MAFSGGAEPGGGWVRIERVLTEFAGTPRRVFQSAVITAVFASLCYYGFMFDLYRDLSGCYAWCVRELAAGNWQDGVATRVPMLNVLLAFPLAAAGMEAVAACIAVSSAFYIGTLFMLRPFFERYLSPTLAAWGCLLYAAAPKVIRFSCSGLIDSSRIFFLVFALLYFFRSAEKGGWKNFLLWGVALGGLAVSRGEGLAVAIALPAALPFFAALVNRSRRREWFSRPGRKLGWFALAMIAALVVTAPFCMLNYSRSGYYTPDMRAIEFLRPPASSSAPASAPAVAKKVGSKDIGGVLGDAVRGAYEPYAVLALLGAVLILRRRRWRWDYTLMAAIVVGHIVLYCRVVSAYRYYIFIIPLWMMFTMTALEWIFGWREKLPPAVRVMIYAGCAVALLFQLENGLSRAFSRKDRPLRQTAAWVEDYAARNIATRRLRMLAPESPEIAYWSKAFPVDGYTQPAIRDYATAGDFDLLVLEADSSLLGAILKRSDVEELSGWPAEAEVRIFRLRQANGEVRQ